MDQIFGEIESNIIQEEIQIMMKLSELITQNWMGDLQNILKLIAELDWYVNNFNKYFVWRHASKYTYSDNMIIIW